MSDSLIDLVTSRFRFELKRYVERPQRVQIVVTVDIIKADASGDHLADFWVESKILSGANYDA